MTRLLLSTGQSNKAALVPASHNVAPSQISSLGEAICTWQGPVIAPLPPPPLPPIPWPSKSIVNVNLEQQVGQRYPCFAGRAIVLPSALFSPNSLSSRTSAAGPEKNPDTIPRVISSNKWQPQRAKMEIKSEKGTGKKNGKK